MVAAPSTSPAPAPQRRWSSWRPAVRLAGDTALLGAAAAWGVWATPFGLWVWSALCLTWMADALAAARRVQLLLAGLAALLAARVALVLGLGTLGPTVPVAAVALAVALAAAVLLLRPAVQAVPVRLRRGLVAFLATEVVLVAIGAGAAHATGRWALLLAVLLLALGDLMALRQRLARSWVNDALGWPMRYGALLLLAHP